MYKRNLYIFYFAWLSWESRDLPTHVGLNPESYLLKITTVNDGLWFQIGVFLVATHDNYEFDSKSGKDERALIWKCHQRKSHVMWYKCDQRRLTRILKMWDFCIMWIEMFLCTHSFLLTDREVWYNLTCQIKWDWWSNLTIMWWSIQLMFLFWWSSPTLVVLCIKTHVV